MTERRIAAVGLEPVCLELVASGGPIVLRGVNQGEFNELSAAMEERYGTSKRA